MAESSASKHRITTRTAIILALEVLTLVILVLEIITLVAGRFPHSLPKAPILTFDISSLKTQLSIRGISHPGILPEWYEVHYLSVCKGTWQSAGTHAKNETSTVCTPMPGGYTFSLSNLLASDAGLPPDSTFLSSWSFAVLNTKGPFIWLAVAIAATGVTALAYLLTMVTTPRLKGDSPLHWPRVGFLGSIAALNTLIGAGAKITVLVHRVLEAKPAGEGGVAWSTGGFFGLTWLATGLMAGAVAAEVVFAMLCFERRGPL